MPFGKVAKTEASVGEDLLLHLWVVWGLKEVMSQSKYIKSE